MTSSKLSSPAPESSVASFAPLRWSEIVVCNESSRLPFLVFFDELARHQLSCAVGAGYEEETMHVDHKMHRIIEPIKWEPREYAWGDNSEFVEDWFEEGEQIVNSKEELKIDEPNSWDKALFWMRAMATASGLMPSR